MIPVSSNQGIFLHGIDVTKPVLEISELPVLPLATPATAINAGNAVYLTAAGKVALATTSTGVLGLAKSNMNTYIDETAGALGGIYGSGCMDVVLNGIVTLRPSVFFNVQGNVQAGQTTVPSWNADIVYNVAPGTDLYYDAAGLICLTGDKATGSPVIGKVISIASATVAGVANTVTSVTFRLTL